MTTPVTVPYATAAAHTTALALEALAGLVTRTRSDATTYTESAIRIAIQRIIALRDAIHGLNELPAELAATDQRGMTAVAYVRGTWLLDATTPDSQIGRGYHSLNAERMIADLMFPEQPGATRTVRAMLAERLATAPVQGADVTTFDAAVIEALYALTALRRT